jgi:hypothetical protein
MSHLVCDVNTFCKSESSEYFSGHSDCDNREAHQQMSRTTNIDPFNLPPLFASHESASCDLEDVNNDPLIGKISMERNQIEELFFVGEEHNHSVK